MNTLPNRDMSWGRALQSALGVPQLGCPILAYDQVFSTATMLRHYALQGAPEGLTIIAREQTHRHDRRRTPWHSASGQGAYLSILLKPNLRGHNELKSLALLPALATTHGLMKLGVPGISLQSPRHVNVDGKRIAGLRVETRLGRGNISFALVNIGINVRQSVHDFPANLRIRATSCHAQGVHLTCDEVILSILREMERGYLQMRNQGLESPGGTGTVTMRGGFS